MPAQRSSSANTGCPGGDDHGNQPAVHTVFESIADRFPDRTAAVCAEDRVSYTALNSWANTIAASLLAAGLREEEPVAIASERSIAQVASVLGILKAGGAYVPLIANQPAARRAAIASDAGCRIVIADPQTAAAPIGQTLHRIDPWASRDGLAANPGLPIAAGRLAYIMYTSGSTGRPKGVMIEHEGVVRLVCGQRYMPFGPDLHFLYAGPLTFDLSTIEIFTPLLHGSKLLISSDEVLGPPTLRRFTRDEGLRGVCISFSLFRAIFEADPGAFDGIPVIGVCGEPADPRVIRRAQERLPDAQFYNAYGPTECTALTTTHQIPRPIPPEPAVVPIGVPLNRMRVRIVDGALQDVPAGETGELLIGGVGLARGYLNDPDLTNARFIRNGADGSRWYHSGDRVRMLPGGTIAYIGRTDDQIKIRGQRIELGEIDAALVADPDIEAASSVVVGTGESASIVACVVPTPGRADQFDPQTVIGRSGNRLTRAMIPSLLVPVRTLPMNQNGKVDRARVGRIAAEAFGTARVSVAQPDARPPSGKAEEAIAGLIGDQLSAPVRDMNRSFAQCGGNSLQAMALSMRLRARYGTSLTALEILEAESLASLAGSIAGSIESATGTRAPGVSQPGRFPMSPAQLRLWTIQQLDPGSAAYNIAYRFESDRALDRTLLTKAWQRLHDRHPALRSRFAGPDEPSPDGELCPAVPAIVTFIDPGPESDQIAAAECVRPFDLSVAPLTRLLIRPGTGGTGADQGVTTGWLVMHHIISDAWSMELMIRDLDVIYRAIESGGRPDLPAIGPGMPDHSRTANKAGNAPATRANAARAAERFSGLHYTGLPRDEAESEAAADDRAHTETAVISGQLRASIEAAADRLGFSSHAVWLALYAAWASRLIDRPEVAIGVAISTRDLGNFEHDVGFFVETVPIRIDVGSHPFEELVRSTSVAMREAIKDRRIPFDQIAAQAAESAPRMRTPITDVFFNLIDRAPIEWPAEPEAILKPRCRELDNGLARFDLLATLYRDRPDWTLSLSVRATARSAPSPTDLHAFLAFARQRLERSGGSAPPVSPDRSSPADQPADQPPDASMLPGTSQGHVLYTVLSVFREVLASPGLTVNDDFFRHGGNSLKAVRVLSMLRERLAVQVSTVVIFSESTPLKLAQALLKGSYRPGVNHLYRMSPDTARPPLHLLPGIEGNLISFGPLVRLLGNERGCVGLEYPGLNPESEPLGTVPEITAYFKGLIDPPDSPDPGPSRAPPLIGYSFGGVVAFDMAMEFQRLGRAAGPLVLLDSYLPDSVSYKSRPQRLAIYARAGLGWPTPARREYISRRWRGFLEGRRLARVEQARHSAPLFDANQSAVRAFRVTDSYKGPVLIFRGRRPDWMTTQQDDGANGWRSCVTGPITVIDFDAEHSELLREQFAPHIARHIADWLRQFDDPAPE